MFGDDAIGPPQIDEFGAMIGVSSRPRVQESARVVFRVARDIDDRKRVGQGESFESLVLR